MRDIKNVPLFPIIGIPFVREGFLQRLIPVRMSPFSLKQSGRVVVTEGDTYLNVTMGYEIQNGTTSENLTMHILTIGLLPGNTNGLGEKLPIIEHKKVNLKEVTYDYPEE